MLKKFTFQNKTITIKNFFLQTYKILFLIHRRKFFLFLTNGKRKLTLFAEIIPFVKIFTLKKLLIKLNVIY